MAVTISGSDGGAAVTTATQKVVKTAYFETGTFATTTAQIPFDATIPQITEGAEFMTLAYTPLNANNILRITVNIQSNNEVADRVTIVALFVGTTANALAAALLAMDGSVHRNISFNSFTHEVVAGGTSELTFRVRLGASASGTTKFNGQYSSVNLGGVIPSSIGIMELTP